jgi:hypothetical protein
MSEIENFEKCDIFTPDRISKIMASYLCDSGTLLEPSVGKGSLLKFINCEEYDVDVYEIKKQYLDEIKDENINKHHNDFLKSKISIEYDNIIMNPPYIRVQDLQPDYRQYIKDSFQELNCGLVDIYYAFIIKCINVLKNTGVMVSITSNSFLYNKSALGMRKYLFENRYIERIIDYGTEKIFTGVSVYCCITVFSKKPKTSLIYNDKEIEYDSIDEETYSLFSKKHDSVTLKDICKITNGIATLRDSVFIHNDKLYEEPCWKELTNGMIKKYIIYPYDNCKIIDEEKFKEANPKTYEYLEKNKEELAKRDKGNKTYPAWYAYGRSQAIKIVNNNCIYIPCFINPDDIKSAMKIYKNMLHYSCLRIESTDTSYSIDIIQNAIINNIDMIRDNSSKRSGGWINLSSRILNMVPISKDPKEEEFDSKEFDSKEFDSKEFDSKEFDSKEFDSKEFDSKEFEEFDSKEFDLKSRINILNMSLSYVCESKLWISKLYDTYTLYLTHGARSSKKVDYFHNFIKEQLEQLFNKPIYHVVLEHNVDAYNSAGRKKCDIVILKNQIPYIVFPVKLIMSNYKQNKNNGWENLTGELVHIKWSSPDVHIIPINIYMNKTPYLNNEKKIVKYETITYQDIDNYNILKSKGICYDLINYILNVEHQNIDKFDKLPNIICFNDSTPFRSLSKILDGLLIKSEI